MTTDPTCLSAAHVGARVLVAGLTLWMLTLVHASAFQGKPLAQLGKRPMGSDLISWLNHFLNDQVGVMGYDPILGALAPPLRVMVHCAACVTLSGVTLCWIPDGECLTLVRGVLFSAGILPAISLAVAGYAVACLLVQHAGRPVSWPGDPRPHKIQRQPRWDHREWRLPQLEKQWLCLSAQEAHDESHKQWQSTTTRLSGEPAGRDIWITRNASTVDQTTIKVDETLVQTMAAGGRAPGVFNPARNPNSADIPFRAQMIRQYLASGKEPPTTQQPKTLLEAIRKGVHFYSMLQSSDGHWSGDYGGPHFLMPGLIVAWYIMGKPELMLDTNTRPFMVHYLKVHQQGDGGWGTHIESPSTMFGTVLSYVSLRLLGMDKDDPVMVKARQFIRDQGGATMASSWAKFYLCLVGVMHWDGHNSVPAEMWLLPNWFPFHPGRMWCHARMVYLPMGYLYGVRFVYEKAESDPVVLSLREELYTQPYHTIPWDKTRHNVAPMDNYSPIHPFMAAAQNFLAIYEKWSIFQPIKNVLRPYGLKFCARYMAAEDLQTNYIDIGPVNKVLNMISAFHVAGGSVQKEAVRNHMIRVADYLWLAEDGIKMKGYNGSQCWDTSFAVQAIYEADMLDEFPDVCQKVWSYLERTQILSTEVSKASPAYKYESTPYRLQYYRHISEGGWPFSTSAHGWPISDCSGEGLKGVLCLAKSKAVQDGLKEGTLKPINQDRLEKACNILLTYQNEDGGFATYENCRGWGWYELLNPSETFGEIMIDYSYVECSMASLTALSEFHRAYPKHRTLEVRHALDKGRRFLKSLQRKDGSWYGSWACCFCYASWFGIEGLLKCDESPSSPVIRKACAFLVKQQRPNGGWGEDFTSCYDKDYSTNGMEAYGDEGSGVVNTGWALLALSAAQYDDVEAVKRGVQYLLKRQLPCGDWPQEGIAGVFNRACGITYTAYRNVFPIWALGRCRAVYGSKLEE